MIGIMEVKVMAMDSKTLKTLALNITSTANMLKVMSTQLFPSQIDIHLADINQAPSVIPTKVRKARKITGTLETGGMLTKEEALLVLTIRKLISFTASTRTLEAS